MKATASIFTLLLATALLGLASPAAEAAEVFKCKDANGKVKYQSQPCGDKATQEKLKIDRGPDSDKNKDEGDAGNSDSDTPELDRKIASEEDERIKQQLQIRKQQCELARRNLETYENADVLTTKNEDGTTRQLSAEEAAAEKQNAHAFLQENCK